MTSEEQDLKLNSRKTPTSKDKKPKGNEKYLDIKKGIEFFKLSIFF
jgi:hypothetical protein